MSSRSAGQHGIAEKLMRHLARDVKPAGGHIRLSVDSGNYCRQRFYEKIGMKWSSAERILARPILTAVFADKWRR
jgi:ribosomal protein S18 acetylase RimI-like enzyme